MMTTCLMCMSDDTLVETKFDFESVSFYEWVTCHACGHQWAQNIGGNEAGGVVEWVA